MAELDSIINAVCEAFEKSGLSAAILKYPSSLRKHYDVPVAAFGIKNGTGVSSGFAEYMGLRYDGEKDVYFELYGKRMELTLGISIYSPKNAKFGSGKCFEIFEEMTAAITKLPSGIRVKEMTCGETKYSTEEEMFKLETTISCTAFLYAEREDSSTEFLDFRVKGVQV